jgi:hypothetical protein
MKTSVVTFCKKRRRDGETERRRDGEKKRRSVSLSLRLSVSLSLCLSVFLTACGKIGDPLPPIPRARLTVDELSVEQQGTQLVLSFPFTRTTPTRLQRVDIYRLIEPSSEPLGLPVESFSQQAHIIHSITADRIPPNNSRITYNDEVDLKAGQRNARCA